MWLLSSSSRCFFALKVPEKLPLVVFAAFSLSHFHRGNKLKVLNRIFSFMLSFPLIFRLLILLTTLLFYSFHALIIFLSFELSYFVFISLYFLFITPTIYLLFSPFVFTCFSPLFSSKYSFHLFCNSCFV